jgi:hypothetical protein
MSKYLLNQATDVYIDNTLRVWQIVTEAPFPTTLSGETSVWQVEFEPESQSALVKGRPYRSPHGQ